MPRILQKGDRFGDLVLESVESKKVSGTSRRIWTCRCVCGRATIVENRNLIRYPARKCEHNLDIKTLESLTKAFEKATKNTGLIIIKESNAH